MENFRSRPKHEYIKNTDWQQLYALTEHWKSELLFHSDDLTFLRHLLDKYFIWITNSDDLEKVGKIGESVLKDNRECAELLATVDKHSTHLADIIDDPFKYDGQVFRKEHQKLEDEIALFIKNVRESRKQLFGITEYIVDSEKLEHFLRD